MLWINVIIKIVSNNIFILFCSTSFKLKKIYSIGSFGFKHKNKKIIDVFNLLLNSSLNYLLEKKLNINKLILDGVSFLRLKIIKKVWSSLSIKQCKYILKQNYNGCRLKKKKRKKVAYKINRNHKLVLRA